MGMLKFCLFVVVLVLAAVAPATTGAANNAWGPSSAQTMPDGLTLVDLGAGNFDVLVYCAKLSGGGLMGGAMRQCRVTTLSACMAGSQPNFGSQPNGQAFATLVDCARQTNAYYPPN